MRLHKPVIFVGDKPSRSNIDPEVAFVGTRSYKTLLSWIADMDVDVYVTMFINTTDELFHNYVSGYVTTGKVVALGEAASEALDAVGVIHFTLPHPSGRNRKLNDKKALKEQLKACKAYIYAE